MLKKGHQSQKYVDEKEKEPFEWIEDSANYQLWGIKDDKVTCE